MKTEPNDRVCSLSDPLPNNVVIQVLQTRILRTELNTLNRLTTTLLFVHLGPVQRMRVNHLTRTFPFFLTILVLVSLCSILVHDVLFVVAGLLGVLDYLF